MHILMGITVLELEIIINETAALFYINSTLKKWITTEWLEENSESI